MDCFCGKAGHNHKYNNKNNLQSEMLNILKSSRQFRQGLLSARFRIRSVLKSLLLPKTSVLACKVSTYSVMCYIFCFQLQPKMSWFFSNLPKLHKNSQSYTHTHKSQSLTFKVPKYSTVSEVLAHKAQPRKAVEPFGARKGSLHEPIWLV